MIAPRHVPTLRSLALRSAVLGLLWWILTGGKAGAWIVGVASVALAVAVSLHFLPVGTRRFSIGGLCALLVFFPTRSVAAGMQVALMAVRPRLDLNPAVLDIPLRLPHEAERIFLAGMLNLLPGTLSVELDGPCLHLHVLDRRLPIEDQVRAAEARVASLFCVALP